VLIFVRLGVLFLAAVLGFHAWQRLLVMCTFHLYLWNAYLHSFSLGIAGTKSLNTLPTAKS
jgi:hypothetical protein